MEQTFLGRMWFARMCLALLTGVWLTHAVPARAAQTLTLNKGDHIAIVGAGQAERFQHDGWLETLIQSRFPDRELVVRNLGHAGDELTIKLRVDGFGSEDEWLQRAGADVVFAFVGFNESFAGPAGLDKFRQDLAKFIQHITSTNYSGRGNARLVLFSPFAFENVDPGNIRVAEERNADLKLYSQAIAEVAAAHQIPFVDLFTATLKAYEASPEPLTINGVHQNERGNRVIARIIDEALFGPRPAVNEASLAKLREAILDKNFYWFQRYRHTDGYNIYGGRSHLSYNGLTNRTVMLREMEILEVMASNRDKRIWAVARGGDMVVDDSNAPPHIPVPTNMPGKGPDGQHVFLSGEEAIAKMEVHRGMKVSLFASEEQFPELANPVQIAFDPQGRLWVAVWEDYTSWKVGTPLSAKLIILEDTDGDGKADKCSTFAENLWDPTGFEFWNNGVLLAQAPFLVYLKDTDGDGKADYYERLLSHISSGDSHHTANSFVVRGGWVYFGEGVFHRSQMESPYGPVRNIDAAIWRFNPRTFQVERYAAYGFANPHGHVVDRWGQHFVSDGTGAQPYHGAVISGHLDFPHKHPTAPQLYRQRTRPLPATEILSSRHFPESLQGNLLVGNVIGFQGILQYRIEDNGSSFRGVEVEPIVRSTDPNFRPVDIEMGPDGAIYFADWHNPIIGHMQHHVRDPSRDRIHGRIYRVTWEGSKPLTPPAIAGQPIEKVLDVLKEHEDRVRYRAQLELSGRDTRQVVEATKRWIASLNKSDPNYEHHLLEALWVFQSHNVVNEDLLRQLLTAKHHQARSAATAVLVDWRDRINEPLALLRRLAEDEHPQVRLQAVRAASFFRTGEAADIALLALKRPMDEYLNYVLRETMRQLDPFWKEALAEGQPIGKDNPAGIEWLLQSVSDAELVNLPRTPAVYQAMLVRDGVPLKHRQEALQAIAQLNNSDPATVLLTALEQADAAGAANTVNQLATILTAGGTTANLKPMRARLEQFASQGRVAATRQLGFAALISVDGNAQKAWQLAQGSALGLRDFAAATALVTDEAARASMYPHLRTLARQVPESVAGGGGPGVHIDYYNRTTQNATLETFEKLTPTRRGTAATIDFDAPVITKADQFAVRFTATLVVPQDGEYTFFTTSDDGSRLYIDGKLVVNNDGAHGTQERSGKVHLTKGEHELIATYFNLQGAYSFSVAWQPPGGNKQAIPAEFLTAVTAKHVREAAIEALAHFPQRSGDVVTVLSPVLAEADLRDAAIATLAALDPNEWSANQALAVAEPLVNYLTTLSVEKRAEPAGILATTLANRAVDRLPATRGESFKRTLDELKIVTILVRPIRDAMLFDRKELFAERGKPVQIIFENTDIMPHNLVIVAPGAMRVVGQAADAMAQDADAVQRHYVPKSDKVLHHTRLLMPGETDRLLFVPPSDVEELPFMCTYPGHWLVMNGTLRIVDKLDPALAQHEPAKVDETMAHAGHHGHHGHGTHQRAFVRNWTTADLVGELRRVNQNRSYDRGKQVFATAGCINCHKMGEEGATIGPDLTKVSEKYTLAEIVREILEPSAVINPDYRSWIIETDWEPIQGIIIKEDAENLHVVHNMLDPTDIKVIPKNEIVSRVEAKLSMMPNGLLVTFEKEEIFDLLAYLQTGGYKDHALYRKSQ